MGKAYSATIKTSGGKSPIHYKARHLPAGIKLGRNTGALSGKPTKAGTVRVTFVVSDSSKPNQTASVTLTLKISK